MKLNKTNAAGSNQAAISGKYSQQDYTSGSLQSKYEFDYQAILDNARGYWPEILESLGIDREYLKNKHGACPVCGGKDRFRFDDKNTGMFYCNNCGAGSGIKLLMLFHGRPFYDAIRIVAGKLGMSNDDFPSSLYNSLKKIDKIDNIESSKSNDSNLRDHIEKIWSAAKPLSAGDPVDLYLKNRGIKLDTFPTSLRYHPDLPYHEDRKLINKYPAMLAAILDSNSQLVSLHRTYIDGTENNKAPVQSPKKLMTPIYKGATKGSAIHLFDPTNGTLALAEGIETVLSFYMATGIPAWATIAENGLKHVILPENVSDVIILVDHDKSNVGQEAASFLSKRLLKEGRKVRRIMPPKPGSDFNDVLLEGCKNER